MTEREQIREQMKQDGPGTFLQQGDIQYDVEWTTLGEYLEYLEKRGVSCNVASFVGTSTLRIHVMGYEDRSADWEKDIVPMRDLVRQAMEEGAVGLSSALIYPPTPRDTCRHPGVPGTGRCCNADP